MADREAVEKHIKDFGYTFSYEDIIKEYDKYTQGYYVCFSAREIILKFFVSEDKKDDKINIKNVDNLFNTTASDVARERLAEAKKHISELQDWLSRMEKAIDTNQSSTRQDCGSPISWASTMMEKSLAVHNEIARCNGAVLVRGNITED